MQAFLDDHNVRIHVDGGDRCLNRAGGIARARSQRMQLIDQAGNVGGKGVAFGMNILTDIDATRAQMRQHLLQTHLLLPRRMTAVVDDDVERWDVTTEACPERPILLVADMNRHILGLICHSAVVEIHPVNVGSFTEIRLPHPQTTAAEDADFSELDLLSPEFGKVSVVNLEVMPPLPDSRSGMISVKKLLQRIRRRLSIIAPGLTMVYVAERIHLPGDDVW